MTESELRYLIAGGETLIVEFKSDQGPLSDADLIETAVCLANRQGGTLLIGVEDDGRVTGLHPRHRSSPANLAAFVASRTVPPLAVEAAFVSLAEGQLAVLTIPAARQPTSTSDGKLLIRYLDVHNRPGCRPLYVYELTNWLAERGRADATALLMSGATWDDLDPLEFVRLRRMVEENRGDAVLRDLSDREIAHALGLVRSEGDRLVPTLAGLLLVGQETALREHVPAHEVAFQVLRGTDVVVNEFRRWPLLRIHEWLMEAIGVRNEEQELMIGGLRVGVPRYDRTGMRETINNALIHRDYTGLGAVHVQLHDDHVRISNPGGFIEGVHPGNLLVVEPRPRNPRLADAFKRVGLVERTGRGVETIYLGQLRNSRRPPDYALSTLVSVNVILDAGPADLNFVRAAILTGRRVDRPLRVDELLAFWAAWHKGAVTVPNLSSLWQQSSAKTEATVSKLVQNGLLEPVAGGYGLTTEFRPEGRGQADPAGTIMAYVRTHGRITRREVVEQCDVTEKRAEYLLKRLVQAGQLRLMGKGRNAHYVLAE